MGEGTSQSVGSLLTSILHLESRVVIDFPDPGLHILHLSDEHLLIDVKNIQGRISVAEKRFIVGRDLLLDKATLKLSLCGLDEEILCLAVLPRPTVLQGRHAWALIPHTQSTTLHQG